ncbi:MAG: CinA family protein, partial [Erythrobacter sp.]|nr:CinA family protein [Erythrobacter sp.]
AKEALLGVRPETLATHGAVSEAVVREMAAGVATLAGANFGVSVSGIAGPDGGSAEKPVGTVWFGWAERRGARCDVSAEQHRFRGDRAAVRSQSVIIALEGLRARLGSDA